MAASSSNFLFSQVSDYDKAIVDPQDRLRHLINYCNSVEVDYHIPPQRYYRSGLEMVRMANVYYSEGSLENAYVLYLKFMTLFLEKIRKHPDFATVPISIKAINQAKLREILPKAEKLKQRLLKQYTADYNRVASEIQAKQKTKPIKFPKPALDSLPKVNKSFPRVDPPPSVVNVNYPDLPFPTVSSTPTLPEFDRSTKPISFDDYEKPVLRTVIVPESVINVFLSKSQRNTIHNIETCGILVGNLAQNELIVTHLILPKQKGTPDSCVTMNEEELFDYQDQHNLITIGWIHTHPTQTAFLSSVDLHTQCPYQLLMPEAIAIVCAPKYNETGFFVLTPKYGLKFIAECRETGFHPHPTDPPLFMAAEHVRIETNAKLEVLDLRN